MSNPEPEVMKLIAVKGTATLQRRFRMATVEDDITYAEFIEAALDDRDRRLGRTPGAVLRKPLGR